MSKGRVFFLKLRRSGEMGKEENQRIPIEVSSFQEQAGSIKSLMEFHLSMRDSWKIPIDLEWTKY